MRKLISVAVVLVAILALRASPAKADTSETWKPWYTRT